MFNFGARTQTRSGRGTGWRARWAGRLPLCLTLFLALGLMGCAPATPADLNVRADVIAALSGEPDSDFARAVAPMSFRFPRDHGAHPEYQTEWWYYTGNLHAADGRRFGYQFTIFRNAVTPTLPARESDWAGNQVYMAHFALTHGARGEHVSFDRYSRGGAGLAGATGEPEFAVWLEDWRVGTLEPGVVQIEAATTHADTGNTFALDLTLRETRPPILHGDAGLSQKGPEPGNASYYYSLVGMESTGSLIFDDEAATVEGTTWMDHEFGTRALADSALGWDWFSLELDNGAVLMFAQIRSADGGRLDQFEGTLLYPDGAQAAIRPADFSLDVLGEWTSPDTGITYPSGWVVRIPDHALELEITPLIPNQEMQTALIYWEGAVEAEGQMGETPVRGEGYVELTGYGVEVGGFQR